jgi:hypothetical protein
MMDQDIRYLSLLSRKNETTFVGRSCAAHHNSACSLKLLTSNTSCDLKVDRKISENGAVKILDSKAILVGGVGYDRPEGVISNVELQEWDHLSCNYSVKSNKRLFDGEVQHLFSELVKAIK